MKKENFTEITLTKFLEDGEFTSIGKGQTIQMAKVQSERGEDYFHIEGTSFYRIPLASIQNYFYNLEHKDDVVEPLPAVEFVEVEKVGEPVKKEEIVAKTVPTRRMPRIIKQRTRGPRKK